VVVTVTVAMLVFILVTVVVMANPMPAEQVEGPTEGVGAVVSRGGDGRCDYEDGHAD